MGALRVRVTIPSRLGMGFAAKTALCSYADRRHSSPLWHQLSPLETLDSHLSSKAILETCGEPRLVFGRSGR